MNEAATWCIIFQSFQRENRIPVVAEIVFLNGPFQVLWSLWRTSCQLSESRAPFLRTSALMQQQRFLVSQAHQRYLFAFEYLFVHGSQGPWANLNSEVIDYAGFFCSSSVLAVSNWKLARTFQAACREHLFDWFRLFSFSFRTLWSLCRRSSSLLRLSPFFSSSDDLDINHFSLKTNTTITHGGILEMKNCLKMIEWLK